MDILNYLANVVKIASGKKKRTVISLAGAGCIGKSTLAEKLSCVVDDCQIVGLDGYMLEREQSGCLTGYDPRRFELEKARQELSALIYEGKSFVLQQYNRDNHQRDIPQQIEAKRVILIEGGLALRRELRDLADISVFLDCDQQTQFELRLRREAKEFGYDEKRVRKRFANYYPDYQIFILPAKETADVVLTVDDNYSFSLVRNSPDVLIPNLQGIVYDLDGTLVDSREENIAYWNSILTHFSRERMTSEEEITCHAHSSQQIVENLFPEEIWEGVNRYRKANPMYEFVERMKLEDNVKEVLEKLREKYKLGIATGRGNSLERAVEKFGFREQFASNIVSVRDVERGKPAPDVLLKALELMGIEPENALYVGDSEVDSGCSKNAGAGFCGYKLNIDGELRIDSHKELLPLVMLV